MILSVSQLSSLLPASLAPQFWGKQIRAAVFGAPAAPWSFPGEHSECGIAFSGGDIVCNTSTAQNPEVVLQKILILLPNRILECVLNCNPWGLTPKAFVMGSVLQPDWVLMVP